MTWIAILCIGVALGWALELLVDFVFWGRRNRRLEAQLGACRSDVQALEQRLGEIREEVAYYQLKEAEFQQCQIDLTDLADKHKDLEIRTEQISSELQSSQQRIGELDQHSSELKAEYDVLHHTLEDVDQWVESSMRRRVWDAVSTRGGLDRAKERSVVFARSVAANATGKMNETAGKVKGRMSTAKAKIGRKIDHSRPVRWLKQTYCAATGLFHSVFKRGTAPRSCSYNSK